MAGCSQEQAGCLNAAITNVPSTKASSAQTFCHTQQPLPKGSQRQGERILSSNLIRRPTTFWRELVGTCGNGESHKRPETMEVCPKKSSFASVRARQAKLPSAYGGC